MALNAHSATCACQVSDGVARSSVQQNGLPEKHQCRLQPQHRPSRRAAGDDAAVQKCRWLSVQVVLHLLLLLLLLMLMLMLPPVAGSALHAEGRVGGPPLVSIAGENLIAPEGSCRVPESTAAVAAEVAIAQVALVAATALVPDHQELNCSDGGNDSSLQTQGHWPAPHACHTNCLCHPPFFGGCCPLSSLPHSCSVEA